MNDKMKFVVYCIEEYKDAKGINGKNVIDLFNRYGVIEYICDYYEALHTTGRQYIVDDISRYIKARQHSTNVSVKALQEVQKSFQGIAEELEIVEEQDVIDMVREIRVERSGKYQYK